jgi:hypothetical protein
MEMGWARGVLPRLSVSPAALAAAIERDGFGVIPNLVGPGDLARMRAFVAQAVRAAHGEYAGFIGPDAVAGSGLDELAVSPAFGDLIRQVYAHGTGQVPPPQPFYQVLRCLTGSSVRQHSYVFHYDSYVVTVLLPIEIPTAGQTGDFLMIPNARRIRSHYAANVVDKLLLDNRLTQIALKRLAQRNAAMFTRIKMLPGNAYVFWGYRSIHTNAPCDADKVRATALFHYANPHARSAHARTARAWAADAGIA